MSTSETAAQILARNIAFFERRTAPRTRLPVGPQPARSATDTARRAVAPAH
jgi:hypothetical protein